MIFEKNNQGFSLVELLVVVAIIGVLTTFGFISYKGIVSKAEETACIDQHNSIKNIIESKFTEARLKSGDAIRYHSVVNADGSQGPQTCFQYFLATHSPSTDMSQIVGTSDTVSSLCNHSPGGGSETLYADHLYRLGFRNCSNFGVHPYIGVSCTGKECRALMTRGRGLLEGWTNDDHVKGQTILDCGASAGFNDSFKCYIGTKVSDDNIIEDLIRK